LNLVIINDNYYNMKQQDLTQDELIALQN
jgi:hypothetical protein